MANGYNNKGYCYNYTGQLDSAMYYYLRSTELMIKAKNMEGSGIVQMNLGMLLSEKRDNVDSINCYKD